MHAHAGTRPWRGEDARDWELPTRFRTAFRSSDVLIPVHTVPAGDLASRRSGDKVDSNNHESEDSRECLHRKRKLSGRRADNPISASDKRAVQQPSHCWRRVTCTAARKMDPSGGGLTGGSPDQPSGHANLNPAPHAKSSPADIGKMVVEPTTKRRRLSDAAPTQPPPVAPPVRHADTLAFASSATSGATSGSSVHPADQAVIIDTRGGSPSSSDQDASKDITKPREEPPTPKPRRGRPPSNGTPAAGPPQEEPPVAKPRRGRPPSIEWRCKFL